MERKLEPAVGRRRFIVAAVATPLILASEGSAPKKVFAATPSCGNDLTPPQTAGPFFKPRSPRRITLIDPGMQGDKFSVVGRVLTTSCQPVSEALIDFWHCDANGQYDNRGYRFRGHQFCDDEGRFSLETMLPGIYPGRTRHIHVIVQAANHRPLTTQLYFPGEALNERDWIFDPRLLMETAFAGGQRKGTFDFVLDLG
ncbi:MAG: intradiol ring-cleavage dioxygenase [Burkholderiales bacterium]|nr:intradiol ring-cleavage dioxygenase [Burkholderiales bacterium]